MRVLFIWWDAFGNNDVAYELNRRGYEVIKYPFNNKMGQRDLRERERLIEALSEQDFEFVFSFDYFPTVSLACNLKKVKYVAWTYDSPLMSLYNCTIVSPYNYIFVFDRTEYNELIAKGLEHIYYLPLAAPVERYDSYEMSGEEKTVYEVPISFVGSTYSENHHSYYKRLCELDDYTKGYADGIMVAQKGMYGDQILENMLAAAPDIEKNMEKKFGSANVEGFYMSQTKYFTTTFLAKYVTVMERQEILTMLSEKYHVALYTLKKTPSLPKIDNRGMAGSKKEASLIYRSSKINLNITLRTIRSGIPLRAFEVMGSGGFLLTNLQMDFFELFEPNVDFVYYSSYKDLMEKTEYYLEHDKERQEIALNGYEKVKKYHTYKERFDVILDVINSR